MLYYNRCSLTYLKKEWWVLKNSKIAYIVLSFALLITLALTLLISTVARSTEKQDFENRLVTYATKLEDTVESICVLLDAVGGTIEHAEGDIHYSELDAIANAVINHHGVTGVFLAPNGIVNYAYPDSYGDYHLGLNIFSAPKKLTEDRASIATKMPVALGPYQDDGQSYLSFYEPLFVEDSFYGFLIFIIDIEQGDAKTSFAFEFEGYGSKIDVSLDNEKFKNVLTTESYDPHHAITQTINTANRDWQLSISKTISYATLLAEGLTLVFGLVISFLLFALLYRQEQAKRLSHAQSQIDQLTGVFNRRKLFALPSMLKTYHNQYAVINMDINKFKNINDTHGHHIGDKILISFAKRLESVTGDLGYVIRLGGDEFIIVLLGFKKDERFIHFIHQLNFALNSPYAIEDLLLEATPSIGYAVSSENTYLIEALIHEADLHMYRAKQTFYEKENML